MSITNILRGIGGEFEIGRVLLACAGASAIVMPVIFQAWDLWNGNRFDVAAWNASYPGGLAVLVGAGVLGIGNKDKQVAAARFTQAQPPLDDKGAGS